MAKRRNWALGAAAGLVALGALFTACGDTGADPADAAAPPPPVPEAAVAPCAVCASASQACPPLDLGACERVRRGQPRGA